MKCVQCNRKYCLSYVPIFQSMTKEVMEELATIMTHRTYKKGETIFLSGERNNHLYVVRKGAVKITHVSEDGREQVIRLIQEGDFFGELSLFRSTALHSNAEVIESTEVCILPGTAFKEILKKSPDLLFNLLNKLSERLEMAEFQLSQLSHHDVAQRLAVFLLECKEKSKKNEFELPVTKTDAASMLGTSRETLSRKLSLFQRKGLIKLAGRKIEIVDEPALQALL